MDFSSDDLLDSFSLNDAGYLLCGLRPLKFLIKIPENDPHEEDRQRASSLTKQLINDAKAGKLKVETSDGEDAISERERKPEGRFGKDLLSHYGTQWFVTRHDLKAWVTEKGLKPAFLFPEIRAPSANLKEGAVDLHDKVSNLLTDDSLKQWIGRAHTRGLLFGIELLAVIYCVLSEPNDKTRDNENIVPKWERAINALISRNYLTPLDKDSLLPMRKEKACKPGVVWFVSVAQCEEALSRCGFKGFCTETIEFLYNETFLNEQEDTADKTKATQKKKESTLLTENLYRAFFCLAMDGYKYDPNAQKSEVPTKLFNMMLDKYGVEISQKTIKRWLNEGANLVEKNPQK